MFLLFILILLILCAIDFLLIQKTIILHKKMEKDRNLFVQYLEKVNDYIMLKNIGEINMFNQRERWYPSPTRIIKKLKEKKSDKNYLEYCEQYSKNFKVYLFFTCITGFISFVIIIMVSLLIQHNSFL